MLGRLILFALAATFDNLEIGYLEKDYRIRVSFMVVVIARVR